MRGDLGYASDPTKLIPGDSAAITHTASQLRSYGDRLLTMGELARKIDTEDGWRGAAHEQFRDAIGRQSGEWLDAANAFSAAATALDRYASTLAWAQRQAIEAIQLWQVAGSYANAAQVERERTAEVATTAPTDAHPKNPGEHMRLAAQDILARARQQVKEAGHEATRAIGRAGAMTPEKLDFPPHIAQLDRLIKTLGVSGTPGELAKGSAARVNAGLERLFLALGPPPNDLLSAHSPAFPGKTQDDERPR